MSIVADYHHPFITEMNPSSDGNFQRDKVACPRAQILSNWFLKHDSEFAVLKWPPRPTDFSPAEHLWDMADREIGLTDVQPANLQQLSEDVMSMWTKN